MHATPTARKDLWNQDFFVGGHGGSNFQRSEQQVTVGNWLLLVESLRRCSARGAHDLQHEALRHLSTPPARSRASTMSRVLSDVSNSPRARAHGRKPVQQQSAGAPPHISAEVMRKADEMLVRATEQIVARNAQIAELQAELRAVKRRPRHGGEESSERRLQALRREYDQAEAMRELRLADAKMQVQRHEREAQHLQHRVDEQTKEITALTDRARRAESSASSLAERHSTALAKLQLELTQVRSAGHAEAAAAARELRAAREKLHIETAAREAAARVASDELYQMQEVMRAEAEQLDAMREHNEELHVQVRTLRQELQAVEEQRQLDLETSSAVQRKLEEKAECTARWLEDTRNELCEMEQAADTAMAGWNEEKDVRVRLQKQVSQKQQADAAAAAMEQSMALATVAEMQQLRAEKARLTAELQQVTLLHSVEMDGLKAQLADAICKADASIRAANKQVVRQQENAAAKADDELESVRAQLRSQREIEDATSAVNRELEDVRAQLADELEARLAAEAECEKAKDARAAIQLELDALKEEQELQQLVASSAPLSLPSPSPVVRIDSAELEQEKELRAQAENQAQQEKVLHSQTKDELEQAVALGEEATSKVEELTAKLAAAQKGRAALLVEIEHQHDEFTAANERLQESEAAVDALVTQVGELQHELVAAAKLLDAASTGLETEKRRSAALSQQVALVMADAKHTAEMQDAEMRAWVTLGTRYGTRFGGAARSFSTPSPSIDRKQSEHQRQVDNALTPWHTPGMAQWPSLSPMSLSHARAPAEQSPTMSPSLGSGAVARSIGSPLARQDRCNQVEHAEKQVEAGEHWQLETVQHLQDDVVKLHVHEPAASGVTWADKCVVRRASTDSPNSVRRMLVSDIRRMLLAPAAVVTPTATIIATEADGLGQLIAQQQAEHRRVKMGAALPRAGTAVKEESDGSVSCAEEAESLLEQSLRSELDEVKMELVAGDRVELAGKAALAGAHRASERVEGLLREAEARAEQAEQQCRELRAQLAERQAAVASDTVHTSSRMTVICPDGVVPGAATSGELMQANAPEGVSPGDEFDVAVNDEPLPEPESELDPEPEPEPEGQIVPRGPSLVQRMQELSCSYEHEPTRKTLAQRMKAAASTQEQARVVWDAANAAVVGITVELMVARTEIAFAQDQIITMRATAMEADGRATRVAAQLQEQYTALEREKFELTAAFEQRLADAAEVRLHCEERLATTLEQLSASLELSELRNARVNDLEMELATAEDKVVALREELAQAVDASLAASRNKMAMVEEWKAQRASLKSELKDCNKCRDALVAENDGLRRQLRAEGKPGTPMRTPGKTLTLRKESAGRRSSVLRQTVGSESSPQTTPERPRWNRV